MTEENLLPDVPVTTVVAAVIERDGRILIGQRPPNKQHPLKWEFPGGKLETGEDPRDGLARELTEELDIRPEIGPEIARDRKSVV